MAEKNKHIVPEGIERERLSDYLIGKFQLLPSRKSVKKAIKAGEILVDNEIGTTGQWVEVGQIITYQSKDKAPSMIFEWRIEVVYEDEYLAIINKPAGFSVSGNHFHTIENALPFNLKVSKEPDALLRFRAVHRLDALTCGLLLVAKTKTSRILLGQLFEKKTIQKRYQAVVIGQLPEEGKIDKSIDEKQSKTIFKTVQTVRSLRNEYLTLVDLFPKTGRTHQLRIHLSQLGFPILGDKLYGTEGEIMKGKGLFLCAVQLTFQHPFLDEMIDISINAPNKFQLLLERETKRWIRFHEK